MRAAALKYTKDVLIKYLRAYTNNHGNYKHFCQTNYAGIDIYDKDPMILTNFPTVILTGSNGQIINAGLSDLAYELYDNDGMFYGHRFGGIYEFSIQIDIGTRSTEDREELTDLITMAYRVHLRRHMENAGVLIKDVRYGGEHEVLYDSDKIYVSTINISTWSEWTQDITAISSEGVALQLDIETPSN